MKVTINIDCTPAEARAFMGLPDLSALNEEAIGLLRQRLKQAVDQMSPDALLKMWLPGGAGSAAMEHFQKAFWEQFGGKK